MAKGDIARATCVAIMVSRSVSVHPARRMQTRRSLCVPCGHLNLLMIFAIAIIRLRRAAKEQQVLITAGRTVLATITRVREARSIQRAGRSTLHSTNYVSRAGWHDPHTGQRLVFRKRPLALSRDAIGDQVIVYLDPHNYRRYVTFPCSPMVVSAPVLLIAFHVPSRSLI